MTNQTDGGRRFIDFFTGQAGKAIQLRIHFSLSWIWWLLISHGLLLHVVRDIHISGKGAALNITAHHLTLGSISSSCTRSIGVFRGGRRLRKLCAWRASAPCWIFHLFPCPWPSLDHMVAACSIACSSSHVSELAGCIYLLGEISSGSTKSKRAKVLDGIPILLPSYLWSRWWFQPIWKICLSNWIISPGVNIKKHLKPPPSDVCFLIWDACCVLLTTQNLYLLVVGGWTTHVEKCWEMSN